MKKKYVQPRTNVFCVEPHSLMAASNNGVGSDIGIGSGGVDGEGLLVPDTRNDNGNKNGIWESW